MRILVFCPNWIGDVVMATPTLRALRQWQPTAYIAGLMRPYVAETLVGNPWLDEMILFDRKATAKPLPSHLPASQTCVDALAISDSQAIPIAASPDKEIAPVAPPRTTSANWAQWNWRWFPFPARQLGAEALRVRRFDLAVLLTNSWRTAWQAWCARIPQRLGYAREGRGLLLTDRLLPPRDGRGRLRPAPVIDYYLALAYYLGAPPQSYQMELFTTPADEDQATLLWQKFGWKPTERVVALNPGAAFGPAKRWPSIAFAELARRLVEERQVKVLILCGPNERGFARFIADASLQSRFVKSLAEEPVSIGLSKAIIRRCELLVTTDSGPRHFAAAFQVPVVTLFGPTAIEWTQTYFADEQQLRLDLPCSPCQQRICPLQHHRCMNELSVAQVYAAACQALDRVEERRAAG